MAVRKSVGMKAKKPKPVGGKKTLKPIGDNLATTPTQYGEISPDYVRQAGDPQYLRSYSEEQIGMLGGREAIFQRVASKEVRAREQAQESTISTETPSTPSEGPTTAPTTYGLPGGLPEGSPSGNPNAAVGKGHLGEMPKPGKASAPGQVKKGRLLKRVAKTTGTTVGEAKGIMKKARKQVRRGNTDRARRTITRALSGGPKAGVKRTPQRVAKAGIAAKKITRRIEARQTAARKAPAKRRKK